MTLEVMLEAIKEEGLVCAIDGVWRGNASDCNGMGSGEGRGGDTCWRNCERRRRLEMKIMEQCWREVSVNESIAEGSISCGYFLGPL